MHLDSRLLTVADFVRPKTEFADIGTDHAYLPVYLIQKGIIDRAIASDVRKGPLENARATVEQCGLSDKIRLLLSDGLDGFNESEVNEIAVAGMGGLLISEFIDRTSWLKDKDVHLILQPMTHQEDLRKTLFDNKFAIRDEKIAEDSGKLYTVFSVFYSGENIPYDNIDFILGKIRFNNDISSKKYILHVIEKYSKKLNALKTADKDTYKLEKIVEELKKWQP